VALLYFEEYHSMDKKKEHQLLNYLLRKVAPPVVVAAVVPDFVDDKVDCYC